MFLSATQIVELTGARRKHTQIRVLKANGIPFTIKLSGWPSVATSAVEGRERNEKPNKKTWSPKQAA